MTWPPGSPKPCWTQCPRNALPLPLPGESAGTSRSHLWAMEPKPVAYVGLARLHHQLGSKAQPHPSSETLSISPGTILNLARKGISDCTRQKKGSIKTYSLLKTHLSQPGESRPHLLFTENLDFFLFSVSTPPLHHFQSDKLFGQQI